MKENKVSTIVSAIILFLQITAEALFGAMVAKLNLLPDKYFIILIAALVFFAALTAVLLFLRAKKPVSTARRLIGWILAAIIIAACLLGGKVMFDAYRTLHAVTNPPAEPNIHEIYVVVLVDDPAQRLQDAADYSFGIIGDYDVDNTQKTIEQISKIIGKKPAVNNYDTILTFADALLQQQEGALIANGIALSMLIEEEGYEDFLDKVRFLHTFQLEQEIVEQNPDESVVQKDITTAPFVVYISGSDTRDEKLKTSRSDVNILAVVNPKTKQVLLLNTPRDYYVANPHGKGRMDKLTNCGVYGIDNSMSALAKLYNLEIQYYAQMNFTGFETMVDAIGGITVHSDYQLKTREGKIIKKGENHLDGETALGFARERYTAKGGDRGRGENQMKVITAIIDKMTTGTTIISNYSSILKSMEGMFRTNVSMEEISMLVKMQLTDMASWNVQSFSVSGKGGKASTYSSPGSNAYVMYQDKELIAQATELAQKVLNGEIITAEDVKTK